jgi:hypothetical protein
MRVIYWIKNINTRRKNAKALLDAHNKINTEKIKNIYLAVRMQDTTTAQRELTKPLKMWVIQMFGNDTRNKNLIHNDIKNSLNLQEACYHLVHNLLFTCYLSMQICTKIHHFTFVVCGCKIYRKSLILRKIRV